MADGMGKVEHENVCGVHVRLGARVGLPDSPAEDRPVAADGEAGTRASRWLPWLVVSRRAIYFDGETIELHRHIRAVPPTYHNEPPPRWPECRGMIGSRLDRRLPTGGVHVVHRHVRPEREGPPCGAPQPIHSA
eukprot:scaffold226024_cov36-Tisochrysis_lutea.AAC.3